MLYLVLCCGIFLLAVVPYLIVQLKKAGQPSFKNKGVIGITLIGVGAIIFALVGIAIDKDDEADDSVPTVLTLNRFVKSYTENA